MRGGWGFWLAALVMISLAADASAGASGHSGPLPRFVTQPPADSAPAAAFEPGTAPPLDLVTALKPGGPPSGCELARSSNLFQVAADR